MISQCMVAIVDDNALVRFFVSNLLKQQNFKILFQAVDGDDCLHELQNTSTIPDLIILDIDMPIKDGFETAALIKASWPSVKIIAMSATDDKASINRILSAGADQFLYKENNMQSELLALISALLK